MENEYKALTRFTTSISKKLYLSNAFFLKQKTLLRHKICGLIQTDTWMVGEEDRDRGLMNTQRLHPLVFANHPLRRNGIKLVDLLHSTLKEH